MNEQLLFEMFNSDIQPVSDVVKNSSKRKLYSYDCGEKLEGAKKHNASSHFKFSDEWQLEIENDPAEAYKQVCKDNILGAPIIELLRENGFSSEAAYAVKLIWDRVAQRPDDNPNARKAFIQVTNELKDLLLAAKGKEQLEMCNEQLKEIYYRCSLSFSPKYVEFKSYRVWLALGKRFTNMIRPKSKAATTMRALINKAYTSEEGGDWIWTDKKTKKDSEEKSAAKRWTRRVPNEVIRTSQSESGVNKPEDLITEFGFRGTQFGNWVDDTNGRYHVLSSGNAFYDLSKILDIPKQSISIYGNLGIAFGSRGSGAASAHYEPQSNIINLTKFRGGGSLCHEWAHALDFNLYSLSYNFINGKKGALSKGEFGTYLPANVTRSFKELMKEITTGEGRESVTVPDILPSVRASLSRYLVQANYDVDKAIRDVKANGYKMQPKKWKLLGFYFCQIIKREGKELPAEFYIPSDYSTYYLDAKQRGAYWKSPHELFARAFESWVEDELESKSMSNSYLVTGTGFGGPYPANDERTVINAAFRQWWDELLKSGVLQDKQIWTHEQ